MKIRANTLQWEVFVLFFHLGQTDLLISFFQ